MAQANPNHEMAIRATDLSESFAELKAVDAVNFSVKRGEVFSLLGPNGAGKSTIISMLSCLLHPDSGDATVMGQSILADPQAVKGPYRRCATGNRALRRPQRPRKPRLLGQDVRSARCGTEAARRSCA